MHLLLLAHHESEREARVADEVEEEGATPVHLRLTTTDRRAQLHTHPLSLVIGTITIGELYVTVVLLRDQRPKVKLDYFS